MAPTTTTAAGVARRYRILAVLAVASAAVYSLVALFSWRFVDGEQLSQRPLLPVLGLFTAAFAGYLAALIVALKLPQSRKTWLWIVLPAIWFRLTLLCSQPIQELDIYRYVWDGAVVNSGVSPFRYSPEQAWMCESASHMPPDLVDEVPASLTRLVELRDTDAGLREALSKVHFAELPTIYPPVSQASFALADRITPRGSSLELRLVVMKGLFVIFDLATLGLVLGLVRLAGRHMAWSIAYAWCPLVMKEVANSGHLDAVAVFFATAAIYLVARLVFGAGPGTDSADDRSGARRATTRNMGATAAGVCLGLGVGAKLYPVVLAPWLLLSLFRRLGWGAASFSAVAFALVAAASLLPMLPPETSDDGRIAADASVDPQSPPLPSENAAGNFNDFVADQDPSRGLATFLRLWEMNDFVFMVIVENLKSSQEIAAAERPWFSVLPEGGRTAALESVPAAYRNDNRLAAFLFTRAMTSLAFVALALVFAWRCSKSAGPLAWLRSGFLTLAWFWLLSPTQNPWYWIWALPLLPLAGNRAWFAVSGLAMAYYLRFWLAYHLKETPVLGTPYPGTLFFDFVVTWIEFAPWFVWLAVEWAVGRWRRLAGKECSASDAGTGRPVRQAA